MFRVIRKADIVLFCALMLAAAVTAALFTLRVSSQPAGDVVITLDGAIYGTYPLTEDRTIEIAGDGFYNEVLIEGGTVLMKSSDCHNQICVEHAPISRSGENIICLPHKLVIEIKGGKEADVDAVVR